MGKTAEELRWEIDQRRSDLSRDLEAIGDRVSPNRMVERRTQAVRSRLRTMKESVMGTADDVTGQARTTTMDLRDRAGDTAGGMRSTASDAMHRAEEGVQHAGERISEMPDMVKQGTQGNPLAAGMVAFGLGLLAATVLPETRRERDLARRAQPRLADAARTAREKGQGMAEEMKPMLQDAATHLKESAGERAQHVTDEARDAAQSVKEDARGAAHDVRDAARS